MRYVKPILWLSLLWLLPVDVLAGLLLCTPAIATVLPCCCGDECLCTNCNSTEQATKELDITFTGLTNWGFACTDCDTGGNTTWTVPFVQCSNGVDDDICEYAAADINLCTLSHDIDLVASFVRDNATNETVVTVTMFFSSPNVYIIWTRTFTTHEDIDCSGGTPFDVPFSEHSIFPTPSCDGSASTCTLEFV